MNNLKPYNTLDNYYKTKYGKKVAKIALNANFTCPNKDGKKGFGGCIYCSKLGSGDFAGDRLLSLEEQFFQIKNIMDLKWKDSLYICYLQANSNTYASIDKLKSIYDEIVNINCDKIIGLSIATRCDCITDDIARLIKEYQKYFDITVELGLQSSNDETKKKHNLGYTNDEFINALNILRKYNIDVVVHIINGLLDEDTTDMYNTINFINSLDIQGVKFHSLLVLKDTYLEDIYKENPFKLLTLEEYVDITVTQIRMLRDDIIIHRLQADSSTNSLIAPLWPIKKLVCMNEIDKKFRKNNYHQADLYKK